MGGLVIAVLVAALVYYACGWLRIPHPIGAILALIIIIAAVFSYV